MAQADDADEDIIPSVFSELKALGVKVPKVKKFKSSIPKQVRVARAISTVHGKMFGVYLNEQEKITLEDYVLPKFIYICTSYLRKYIQKEIGLFRKAGSVARQKDLRAQLENGGSIQESEPNDIASLLKQWLRELPDPLVPSHLQDLFIRCQNCPIEENRIAAVLLCCHLLPAVHLHTLKHLLEFLSDVASNSDKNMMGVHNLALVMAPNIFVMEAESIDKSSSNLVQLHMLIIELLINNVQQICVTSPYLIGPKALRSSSDFDLSMDALDCSPLKSKKKRRSGHVQDLFSGFKRFVVQSAVPSSGNPNAGKSAPPSATKRKAGPESFSPSPLKKQATASSNVVLDSTPDNKCSQGGCGKASSLRVRRKSFGLLRRRNRKSQPNFKPSETKEVEPEMSISALEEGLPDSCVSESSPLLSELDIDLLLKSTFSQKSISASHLVIPDECPTLSTSSSEGCLRGPRSNNSSYNLRSASLNQRPLEDKADEESQPQSVGGPIAKHASPKRETVLETDDSLITKDYSQTDTLLESDEERIREKINLKESQTSLVGKKTEAAESGLKSSSLESKHKIQRHCSLRVSRRSREMNCSQIGRANSAKFVNLKSKHQRNLGLNVSDTNTPVKRRTRVSARKGSIVRGRPNTVKTGLPNANRRAHILTETASSTNDESEGKDLLVTASQSPKKVDAKGDSSQAVRTRSHSDSKIHYIKTKSPPVARIRSFRELSARKCSSPKTPKSPVVPEKENAFVSESPFKTPTVPFKTPETWHSARQYFELEKARENAGSNKRESIAMILRNKAGHVQQKVHLYDGRSRASSSVTPLMMHACDSWSSQKRRSKRHSPLPPPPKFVIPDSPPRPSYPLKELTNLSPSSVEPHQDPCKPPTDRIRLANFTVIAPSIDSCF